MAATILIIEADRDTGRLADDPLRVAALNCDTGLVGLTRCYKPGDHAKIKTAGFANDLHKPIEPEIFVSQVERLLPARLRRPQPLSS